MREFEEVVTSLAKLSASRRLRARKQFAPLDAESVGWALAIAYDYNDRKCTEKFLSLEQIEYEERMIDLWERHESS